MKMTVASPGNVPIYFNASNANYDKMLVFNYLNVLNIASI